MTEHTAWLTIGFNDDPDVATHLDAIRTIVTALGGIIVTEMRALGEWDEVEEYGQAFLLSFPATTESDLRAALGALAGRHNQEAVGFVGTCGGDTLIKGVQE